MAACRRGRLLDDLQHIDERRGADHEDSGIGINEIGDDVYRRRDTHRAFRPTPVGRR